MLEPGGVKGRKAGEGEHPPLLQHLDLALDAQRLGGQVDLAGPVPKARMAARVIDPPLRRIQRLGQAAQLGAKRAIGPRHLAQRAAKDQATVGHVAPIHLPQAQRRVIPPARHQVALGDRVVVQRAHRLGIVDRQPGRLDQRARAQTAIGAKGHAAEGQPPVMVGEPQGQPIRAPDRPGARQRGGPGHTRTSTTGMSGTCPAWKDATETAMRSVSKRTGTSNS